MPMLRIIAVWLFAALAAVAQRDAPNVTFGHIHINSADPNKTIAFWTDVIGLSTWSRDSLNGVSTLGVLIVIARSAPSGPSAGSAIDHIGFKVPDLRPFIGKLANTNYKSFQPAGDQLMIDGPDGVRIELAEDSSVYAPLQFDHIHFYTTRPNDVQAWYAKVFGARSGGEDQPHTSLIVGDAAFLLRPPIPYRQPPEELSITSHSRLKISKASARSSPPTESNSTRLTRFCRSLSFPPLSSPTPRAPASN